LEGQITEYLTAFRILSTPPVIELEELANATADDTQVFTAQIGEDNELQDATLYHRREGQLAFQAVPMVALGSTGLYSVSIATDPTDLRNIEYYIQARDTAGNRTVNGFAFDPYIRTLTSPSAAQGGTAQSTGNNAGSLDAQAAPFYKRRWFQVAVGVVAVGILASTVGNDDEETILVPLTINVER